MFGQIWNILSVPSNTQLILCSNSVLNLENMVEDFPSSVSLIDYGFQEIKIEIDFSIKKYKQLNMQNLELNI